MPATDLQTLLQIAPLVEAGVSAVLTTALPGVQVLKQRQVADQHKRHVAVQFTLGQSTGHLRPMGDGTFQRDAWNYTLQVNVQTIREEGDGDPQAALRGKIAAAIAAARYDSDFLPYYVLSTMIDQSQSETLQVAEDCDQSTMVWTGMLSIRSSAWPA